MFEKVQHGTYGMCVEMMNNEARFTLELHLANLATEWLFSLREETLDFDLSVISAKQPVEKREKQPYRMNSLMYLKMGFILERFIAIATLKAACILQRKDALRLNE